jgi:hypothetical protein
MKREGGREAGYRRRWFHTMAMDVCLLFNVAAVEDRI